MLQTVSGQNPTSPLVCFSVSLFWFLFCMYIFSTVNNIKRDNLYFLSMPWIGSVLADQDADIWAGSKSFKEEHLPLLLCKGKQKKLDWDNPVCHNNTKQTWNLDCNFSSQGGSLMLCGRRIKRMRRKKSYLHTCFSPLTEAQVLSILAKKNAKWSFQQQKPKHPFFKTSEIFLPLFWR